MLPVPLTAHQQDIWAAHSRFPELNQFNCFIYDRYTGEVDLALLADCLVRAVERNDALQLRFDERDGEPYQWRQAWTPEVEVVDLRDAPDPAAACAEWMRESFCHPFDLRRDPLIQLRILRETDTVTYAYVQYHHILTDAWGINLYMWQVRTDYAHVLRTGAPAPLDPPSYLAYAERERGYPDSPEYGAARDFFRTYLDGAEPALFGRRAPNGARRSVTETFLIRREVIDRIRARGESPFGFVSAAISLYLSRVLRADEVILGVPVANRLDATERDVVGHFANTLPMRLAPSPDKTMRELVAEVRSATRALKRHERFSLGSLLRALRRHGAGHPQLFDVTLSYMRWSPPVEIPGLRYRTVAQNPPHDLDTLAVLVNEMDEVSDVAVEVGYAVDVFDDDLPPAAVAGHLSAIIEQAAAAPDAPLRTIDMLSDAERHTVLHAHNDTAAPFPDQATLPGLIAGQTARAPERVALVDQFGAETTYAELDAWTGHLAAALRSAGVRPGHRVAVLARRGPQLVAAVQAAQRAGAAYVPVDPDHPPARVAYLLADSRPTAVLVGDDVAVPDLPQGCAVHRVGRPGPAAGPAAPTGPTADDLAYVIYTSGSTGRPKGTMVEHRSVVNRLTWMQRKYPIGADDVLLQKTPATFDVSVWELFWWALAGARLALLPPGAEKDPREILHHVAERRVTVIHFVPAMLGPFLDLLDGSPELAARAASLRYVFCSGEALPPARVEQFNRIFAGASAPLLVNLYGPTEATVDVSWYDCPTGAGPVERVPIGRPIDNIRLYVLGPGDLPQPVGVPGELCVSGVGVARGYLDRPELTAERFGTDPFVPGQRLYRTGDLVRRLADGTLEYLGRLDGQVKIRGNRVELGEVEQAYAALPAVRDVVVVDRQAPGRGTHLVAYYQADEELDPTWLREQVARVLPEYMIPAYVRRLDRIPLSANGKVDRRALPEVVAATDRAGADAPRNAVEATLLEVWTRVLNVGAVGVHDNYFAVGGDSILMLRVRAEAERRGLYVRLGDMVRYPTIAGLAPHVGTAPAEPVTGVAPFALVSDRDRPRLTGAADAYPTGQVSLGMLYHSREHEVSAVYHDVFRYTVKVPWDEAAFRAAFAALRERHPVLRASFDLAGYSEPLQVVWPDADPGLEIVDLRETAEDVAERAVLAHVEQRRFHRYEFERPPLYLFRAHVRPEHVDLVFSFHHALLDGWSAASLVTELLTDYLRRTGVEVAPPPPAPTVSVADHVAAERRALAAEGTRAYWRDLLADTEPTRLDGWRAHEAPAPPELVMLHVPLPPRTEKAVRELSASRGLPVKSILFGAYCLTLRLFGGREDVVTGMVTHGRPELAEAERIVGMFLNTIPVRLRPGQDTWLAAARDAFRQEQESHPHRRYPLGAIQRDRGGSVLETAFNYVHLHVLAPLLRLPQVELLDLRVWEETNFSLLVNAIVDPVDDQITLRFDADGATVSRAQAQLFADTYLRLLDRLTTAPDEAPDLGFLAAPAPLAEPGEPLDVVTRFRDQARRTPDAVAVSGYDGAWTYRDLALRVDRVARRLLAAGVRPDEGVGIVMDRSPELVAVLMGVARSGAAAVPLDVTYPRDRLAVIVGDARPRFVVADAGYADLATEPGTLIPADEILAPDAADGTEVPPVAVDLESVACVLFTSGSTGRPKGVQLTHRLWANYVDWQVRATTGAPGAVTLQFAPLSFDVSFQEIYSTLAGGGSLRIVSDADRRDPTVLLRLLDSAGVGRVFLPYVALQQLAEAGDALGVRPRELRVIISSGEQLRVTDEIRRFCAALPGTVLENQYGPTETNLASTYLMSGDPATFPALPPIGLPIDGTELHVLGPDRRPRPVGAAGEIYLGGDCLSRGYHDRPDLTEERFVPHPFRPGARLYRTGDLGRLLPDGNAVWLGRIDTQVKIRGFRVEIAEVELAVLRAAEGHPGVREVAVVARRREGLDAYLVAFLVGEATDEELDDIRRRTRAQLPEHMVPSAFVPLAGLPLTPSGKRDDAALRAIPLTATAAGTGRAPRDGYERALCEILADILELPEVGIDDNFFDVGGTSVSAMRLVVTIEKRYGVSVPLAALITTPTVAELAERLRERSAHLTFDPVVPIRTTGSRPPLFLVHPLGGNVLCYVRLARHLGPGQPVYALQAAGADPGTEPLGSVPELAASYLAAIRRVRPDGPYVLGGWSFGGFVALEMAHQLRREDPAAVDRILLLDSIAMGPDAATHAPESSLLEWFFWELLWFERGDTPTETIPAELTTAEERFDFIVRRAVETGVLPRGSSRGAVQRLYDIFRANWNALLAYRPEPIDQDVLLLRATGTLPDALLPMHRAGDSQHSDPSNGLSGWTTRELRVVDVPGDHLVLLEEPHVNVTANILADLLDAGGRQPSGTGRPA
ncbi:amino acid adenylation domain-containing protein [Micromonospora sp. B11E3]|uniref:amino acid adenylation domain-containing protein n=1 Tax=Micromonospora sp. B11E3 TaxID=3153562 RepID=UPI00325DB6E8